MQKRVDEKSPAFCKGRRGRSLPAAFCGAVGKLILVLVILACLPVPVARLCGYEVYDVVSGSMEPAIPVGSAVFVRALPPAQIEAEDVIAFQSHDRVITHRVVENNKPESSLVTQGDANAQPDPEAVPYGNVIGRVERHVPGLGWLLGTYTAGSGRIYLICFAAAGALLSLIPALASGKRRETGEAQQDDSQRPARRSAQYGQARHAGAQTGELRQDAPRHGMQYGQARHAGAQQAALRQDTSRPDTPQAALRQDASWQGAPQARLSGDPDPEEEAPIPAKRGGGLRRVLTILLALVFIGSLGGYAFTRWRAQAQRQTYTDLAQQYAVPDAAQTPDAQNANTPPIAVDFEALRAVNSDIVGWIYCEDTAINYPVLYGETNDTYLRRDYEGKYNVAGSIFIDVKNSSDFSDVNTILYGHHMNDGTMFAGLENWQDQAYFDAHPVIWLLTPEQNYRILPFSAYETDAYSETYTLYSGPCEPMNEYLRKMAAQSAVQSGIVPDGTGRYVLLSTCASAYGGGDERSVVHGVLQPVG